jgi:probable F420-dependent oxidoreductase
LKVDGGIPAQLALVPDAAGTLERCGYDGGWTAELNHDPFLPLALAAEHTSTLELGTGIAVAFARNPMIVANLGWDLQSYSGGRFMLGLGSQIRPHIEKRFSMPWSEPARRMREFVLAMRAIWSSWQDGSPLRFEGDFYTHKLMTPVFVPEPMEFAPPKVFLAAVGDGMTEVAGEVANGMIAHGFTTEKYAREVTIPALERGLARAGRTRDEFELSGSVFVVLCDNDEMREQAVVAAKRHLAFYGSTPAYRGVLEAHGWGDLQTDLHRLSKEGKWAEMGDLVDDEVLDALAIVAPSDRVGERIVDRWGSLLDRVTFFTRGGDADADDAARRLLARLRDA